MVIKILNYFVPTAILAQYLTPKHCGVDDLAPAKCIRTFSSMYLTNNPIFCLLKRTTFNEYYHKQIFLVIPRNNITIHQRHHQHPNLPRFDFKSQTVRHGVGIEMGYP